MEGRQLVSALLGYLNDGVAVHQYGAGLLVDLPQQYSDRDSVRLLVEPWGDGQVRVSDQAAAATRLSESGLNLQAEAPARAWSATVRGAGLFDMDPQAGELATIVPEERLAEAVFDLSALTLQAEQLKWLAREPRQAAYHERVTERVLRWASDRMWVRRNAPIALTSGRTRQVTLEVREAGAGDREAVYVQAVARREREASMEHCFYLFGLSAAPRPRRIAALDGGRSDWSSQQVEELSEVSDVHFFEDSDLEAVLAERTAPGAAMNLQ